MADDAYGSHHLADVKITIGKRDADGHTHAHDSTPIIRRRKVKGNHKPMRFASLHHHTTFSYKDGFQLPEAHIRRAEELQIGAVAFTEHGNVSSHVRAEMACAGSSVKPIFGVELYTGDVGENATQMKNHLTILAKDQRGYSNLMRLVTRTYEEGFHYEPTASGAMLAAHKDGLIVLSGCQGSLLFSATVGGKQYADDEASFRHGRQVAQRFRRAFGDAYFIEVQAFPELEKTRRFNPLAERMSRELGIPLVATMDVHYTELDDSEVQMILHNIRGGNRKSIEEQAREWGYDVPLCPPLNDNAIFRRLVATGLSSAAAREAVINTELIAQECNVKLPKLPMVRFPVPDGYADAQAYWDAVMKQGWEFRGCDRLPVAERRRYKQQLLKEKSIMESKGFIDYILIVRDAVVWCKDREIPVGPARGSAGASLVCWLLRITEVNPMIFPNLVFERFIDVTREDLPDIDLDFPSESRTPLRDYLLSKYGEGCVNNLGTFTYFKNKLALDDVARVFKVPKYKVEKIKDFLIERSSGDLRASSTIEDTIDQFPAAKQVFDEHPDLYKAQLLEGNIKAFGVHAAGLVISDAPPDVEGVCAMYAREMPKGSGNWVQVVSLDKYDAERQGLVKMDFLGLSTMSQLWMAMKWLGMSLQDLYDIPLEDPEVYNGFRANDVVGVFQMDGRACRYVCGALKPDNFAEVCDVNALARPGALHNGSAQEYAAIKHGMSKPKPIHPAVDPILEPTRYQIVYQEQILRICREVGNFPWEKTAEIRKIIAKKHGDAAFNRRKSQFMEGALTVHERDPVPPMTAEVAERIWGEMITAGSYGFCLTGDTELHRAGGNQHQPPTVTVADLYAAQESDTPWGEKIRDPNRGVTLLAMDDDGRVRPARLGQIHDPVQRPILRVTTVSGRVVRMSDQHVIMTPTGYRDAMDLRVGDEIVCMGERERQTNVKRDAPYSAWAGMDGAGNPSWIDGRTTRKREAFAAVDRRAGGRCEHCGEAGGDGAHDLEHAHIVSLTNLDGDYARYHHERNVLLLCNPCHKKLDYGMGVRKKRWTVGRPTIAEAITAIEPDGMDLVYDITMDDQCHNYVGNGMVHHNNAAHATAYGMLAVWTMWLKRHHPAEFYASSLAVSSNPDRDRDMLRDAAKHGVRVLPPDPQLSERTWLPVPDSDPPAIRAGFSQIDGIGDKMATAILDYRAEHGLSSWEQLTELRGIGAKTIEKITAFVGDDDPFDALALDANIAEVKRLIASGDLGDLPQPTHKTSDLPYDSRTAMNVVWLGTPLNRNVRDIFETNRARTGEELDPEKVKRADLNEWVLITGEDEDDRLIVEVDRFQYPKFREAIFNATLGKDLLLVDGYRPKQALVRKIKVRRMWVITP